MMLAKEGDANLGERDSSDNSKRDALLLFDNDFYQRYIRLKLFMQDK